MTESTNISKKILAIILIFVIGISIGTEIDVYSGWRRTAYESLSFYTDTSSNRSYMEFIQFLENDTTNNASYSSVYNCKDFCYDFIRNATRHGFRCGFMVILYDNGSPGHSVVVVNTEFGLIYVEPQSDDWHFFIDNISGMDIDKVREINIVWSK